MRKTKESNLYMFLKSYSLTKHSADYFKDVIDFKVDQKMAQRKLVQLGRALSRIVSMDMVFKLGEHGFNSDMIANSLKVIRSEIKTTIDRKSTRLNSSHVAISYAVFCLKKKKKRKEEN